MDDRDRRQVEVGAGLQESRLNTELIEWLQKWGPRALYVLLAIVLAYLGWNKWQEHRQRQIDQAFADYQAELLNANPDVLLDIAEKYDGKASVWTLATLDAADLFVQYGRLGVRPGTDFAAPTDEDRLTDATRNEIFRKAMAQYEGVLARHKGDPSHARFAQEARWGIASASISLGEIDRARAMLKEYVEVAERERFTDNERFGRERLAMLDEVAEAIPVYAVAQLPIENRDPAESSINAEVGPGPSLNAQGPSITTSDGKPVPIRQVDPSELRDTEGNPYVDPKARERQEQQQGAEPGAETPDAPASSEPQPEPSADDPE